MTHSLTTDTPIPFEARLNGHLQSDWQVNFAGLQQRLEDNGTTRLYGELPDQAALHALMRRVRDSGMTLLSMQTGENNTMEMQAFEAHRYGGVEQLERTTRPLGEPGDGEVRVRIVTTAMNAADWRLLRANPPIVRLFFGLLRPKHPVLGADIAGVVEAVGRNVAQFSVGDEVFGSLSEHGFGGFASHVCAPAAALLSKPAALSFDDAAALLMAGSTALQGIRNTGLLKRGERVLVHGASGGVGSFAVQIAKALGAHVTAVCSTAKVDQARRMGADEVIDYTQTDFASTGQRYDLIFWANGERPPSEIAQALTPQGRVVLSGSPICQTLRGQFYNLMHRREEDGPIFRSFVEKPNPTDWQWLAEQVTNGTITPVIDSAYPLTQLPEAMAYIERGHAAGKVLIHP